MSTEKIRTTIQPEQEVEVSKEEATDLRRMGLVANTKATTAEGARRAVERQQAAATATTSQEG